MVTTPHTFYPVLRKDKETKKINGEINKLIKQFKQNTGCKVVIMTAPRISHPTLIAPDQPDSLIGQEKINEYLVKKINNGNNKNF